MKWKGVLMLISKLCAHDTNSYTQKIHLFVQFGYASCPFNIVFLAQVDVPLGVFVFAVVISDFFSNLDIATSIAVNNIVGNVSFRMRQNDSLFSQLAWNAHDGTARVIGIFAIVLQLTAIAA